MSSGLIPLYLLINIWGRCPWGGGYAATKFLLYTAVSGIFSTGCLPGEWLTFSGASDFAYNPLLSATLPLETQILLLRFYWGSPSKRPYFRT